jgi:hypothetical protein
MHHLAAVCRVPSCPNAQCSVGAPKSAPPALARLSRPQIENLKSALSSAVNSFHLLLIARCVRPRTSPGVCGQCCTSEIAMENVTLSSEMHPLKALTPTVVNFLRA